LWANFYFAGDKLCNETANLPDVPFQKCRARFRRRFREILCRDCGYVGIFILEMDEGDYEEMLKSKREDLKKRSKSFKLRTE